MFALGELGIGLGLAWLVTYRNPGGIDYRLVLLGSILPDLIDKPLGALLNLEARLWAHSLLFLAAILSLGLVPRWRGLRWVAFGDAVHLLVDLIWQQPGVALWPFLGVAFPPGTQSFGGYLDTLLHDPYVQFGEIVGAALLVAFAWTHGIRSWASLKDFLLRGRWGQRSDGRPPSHD